MTPQATNRRERGLTSCCSCSWKLRAFTKKELETGSDIAWCTNCGQGECPGMGWWWRELKEANKPTCRPNCTNTVLKTAVSHTFWLKNRQKHSFYSKELNKIYSQDVFWGINKVQKFSLFKALGKSTCSKFWESYSVCPQPSRLRLIC
jgi:hypothetical protein